MNTEIEMIKKRINEIKKEQNKIEKQIEKQEEDNMYDADLYTSLEKLEEERNNLELKLDNLERM